MDRLRPVLVGTLLSVIVLLVTEGALRISGTFDITGQLVAEAKEEWECTVGSDELGWQLRPSFQGRAVGGYRSFDVNGFRAEDSVGMRDSTRNTVLFIGGSITFGFGVETNQTFAKVLTVLRPGIRTVNLGVSGYSSYQGAVILEPALKLVRPQLIVASFNFNDRRYVASTSDVDSPERMRASARARRRWDLLWRLEGLRVVRAYNAGLRKLGLFERPPRFARVDSLQPRVSEVEYERNLTRIASMAQRAEIPMIFLLQYDNPAETAPLRMTSAGQAPDSVIAALRAAVARSDSPYSELIRLRLIQLLMAKGDTVEAESLAEEQVRVPSTFPPDGAAPIRVDADYHTIMRRVAAQFGDRTIDVGSVLQYDSKYFLDESHLTAAGHRLVAAALAAAIDTMGLARRPL